MMNAKLCQQRFWQWHENRWFQEGSQDDSNYTSHNRITVASGIFWFSLVATEMGVSLETRILGIIGIILNNS